MCGSSSTTTTVPFSALTHLAFHLAHPELPESGHPLQNPHDCRTGPSPSPFTISSQGLPRKDPTTRGVHMRNGRTHPHRGALALASAATLGAAGVAGASTPGSSGTTGSSGNSGNSDVPSTLAGIKSKANTDITDRVNSLNSAIEKVKAAKGLGSGQGTLEAYLGTDITPLQQLDATIQGETSAQQAAADFRTIFTNFRVYRLVLPGAHIAGDAFRVTTTAVPNLQAASTKAQQY